jgi:predicted amidophosphoribosyltransferase
MIYMALLKCPDCERDVSDKAASCPNCGSPISTNQGAVPTSTRDVNQKSTAVAHIWIESPLDGSKTSQLFSTHPPLSTRIATLRAMEGNA